MHGLLQAVEQHGERAFEFAPTADVEHVEQVLDAITEEALRSEKNVKLTDLV